MLTRIDFTEKHVVGFRWEGEFDKAGFKQSLVEFLPELKSHSRMNVYMEVLSLTEVEAQALWEEARFELKNFNEMRKKIDKVAVVSDMSWIRNLSEASASVVPGIKLKAFEMREAEAARTWVK